MLQISCNFFVQNEIVRTDNFIRYTHQYCQFQIYLLRRDRSHLQGRSRMHALETSTFTEQHQPIDLVHPRRQFHPTPRSTNATDLRHPCPDLLALTFRLPCLRHRAYRIHRPRHRTGSYKKEREIHPRGRTSRSGRRIPLYKR